ncbi:MAG: aminotransferase class I/II-fold pyridoxal phosphate-dependent enzyme [Firmicutes bacterium]|nr:aminotransferase class I/II-fold pyridoxal phosphate-dependent enzyme [Bacillota bacterium]
MGEQTRAEPAAFLQAVAAYARHNVLPWHTPGHKQGRGAAEELQAALGPALQCDLSDVLYDPPSQHSWDSLLREAQERAAALFGASWTRFLINGTSGGVHAMLLATLTEDDVLIVPRQAHMCVAGGLVLSGAKPSYIPFRVDPVSQLPLPEGAEEYAVALQLTPKAKAVVVTYSNYYGLCCDLRAVANMARERGVLVLVDEAHGAHYAFHPSFPRPALACGAHMTVQSTHKTLSALTQASMLHGAADADIEAVDRALDVLQSTSPSSLLLSSLDSARAQMAAQGEALWTKAIEVAEMLRQRLRSMPGVRCLGADELGSVAYSWDPTRLIVGCEGISGLHLAAALRMRYGIQVEMADTRYCVVLVGLGDNVIHGQRLAAAIDQLRRTLSSSGNGESLSYPDIPPMALTPRRAAQSSSTRVSWNDAVGRISGQTLCPYPPGVPVLVPGELVTEEVVEFLRKATESGFYIRGYMGDGKVTVIA